MSQDDGNAVEEMVSEFIAEIKDDLAGLETDLLAMEEAGGGPVDDDLVNHAFRTIHSIKGGAGFIRFTALSDLGHAMENLLMQIREKKRTAGPVVVDALLMGFDKMKLLVDHMGEGEVPDISTELNALAATMDHGGAKGSETRDESGLYRLSAAPAETNALLEGRTFDVDARKVETALGRQQFVYAAAVEKAGPDLMEEIRQVGEILYPDPVEDITRSPWFCVVATILDKPLLAQVLETPLDHIVFLDRQFTDIEGLLAPAALPDRKKTDLAAAVPQEPADKPADKPALPAPAQQKPDAPPEIPAGPGRNHTSTGIRENGMADESIRINVRLISRLMNRAGELVLCRNQLRPVLEQLGRETSEAASGMQNLAIVTADIQDAIMQMRMKPVSDLLGKYKRVVRDMARRMDKKVAFYLRGGAVEVDRKILEQLANPMTHLIRNCIDHGIEIPAERIKKGKPETGNLTVEVFHQGGNVHINIRDDGAGMDPDMILAKACEKGLVEETRTARMSDREKINLIFLPGFSTSDTITDISGRGVGMDVVKTNLERLRGHISIDSDPGAGTTVQLIIPLTLAIVPSLIVGEGEQQFAIPQVNVKEIIYLSPGEISSRVERIAGHEVFRLRERLLPVLRLRTALDIKTFVRVAENGRAFEERRKHIADRRRNKEDKKTKGGQGAGGQDKRYEARDRRRKKWDAVYVVVLKFGGHLFGLLTEKLYDIEEVVVEPLSDFIKDLKWFAGATILGDGRVIMVLDVPGMAADGALTFDSVKDEEARRSGEKYLAAVTEQRRDLLLFENSPGEYFALDLSAVSRLESLKPGDVYRTGDITYTEHRRQAAFLFTMDAFVPASPCPLDDRDFFAIFLKDMDAPVGVAALTIVDTLRTREAVQGDTGCPESVMGKLFKDNMMIQVLDPDRFRARISRAVAAARGEAPQPA